MLGHWRLVGGMRAVVRLLLEQSGHDRRARLNTGGFASGYRGSPIGRLDSELWSVARQLRLSTLPQRPRRRVSTVAAARTGTNNRVWYRMISVKQPCALYQGRRAAEKPASSRR